MFIRLFCLTLFVALLAFVEAKAACPEIKLSAETAAKKKLGSDEQPRFALLIGINNYKNPAIRPLKGAENDVAAIGSTLVENFNFKNDKANIQTLCGEAATREAILQAFREHLIKNARLAKQAGKNAIIVFHFSGHGSQFPDQDGDETADGEDETLLPYDTRTDDVFDILDDEIDDLFAELAEYTSNAVFILDNCHSGSGTRGELVAREAPTDKRSRPVYKRKFTPTQVEDRAQKYVTIAAAAPHQKAYERPAEVNAGTPNGALSFHLSAALRRADANTTWRDIEREIYAAVKNEIPIQDAGIEGGKKDEIIFDGTAARKNAAIEIIEVQNDSITFRAGKIHGVQIGSQIAIYNETATKFVGKEGWLTNAVVTDVRFDRAVAKLPAATKDVTKKSNLVLTAPTLGGTAVSLVLDDASLNSGEMRTEISGLLKENPLVKGQLLEISQSAAIAKKTANRNSPILRLKKAKFGIAFPVRSNAVLPDECMSENDLLPPNDTNIYFIEDVSGEPLLGQFFTVNNPNTPQNIVEFLSFYAQYRTLQNIENLNSELTYSVQASIEILPLTVAFNCTAKNARRSAAQIVTACAAPPQILSPDELPQGAVYRLKVKNASQKPLFITAFYLGSDGKIKQIYPDPKFEINEPIQAGKFTNDKFSIPIVMTQPAGKEMIKIFVTPGNTKAPELRFLETPTVTQREGSVLGRLLTNSGLKMRSEPLPPDTPNGWGVVSLSYNVTTQTAVCPKK